MRASLVLTPASEQVRLVATGRVSAVELVEAHLAQIARLNPSLNAFVDIRAESARAEAAAQDFLIAQGAQELFACDLATLFEQLTQANWNRAQLDP